MTDVGVRMMEELAAEYSKGRFIIFVNRLDSDMFLKVVLLDGRLRTVKEMTAEEVIAELSLRSPTRVENLKF